jgi:hypothetical protein
VIFSQVQLHQYSGSCVSVGEILTAPPDVKYKDVLLCIKSGFCGDPSGRDSRTLQTHAHTEPAVVIQRQEGPKVIG